MSFKILKFNCCGLDVHKTWIYACIGITDSNNRTEYKQARFSSFTKGLNELCDWLAKYNCTEFLHHKDHRIRIVYTPKHCSWMNQIEIWFGIINRRLLKRKSYRSIEELKASILRFVEQYNVMAKPFKWTYKGVPLTV